MDKKRRAIFFDRDDTLMVNIPYLSDPAGVKLFPETKEALTKLEATGFLLFIISNQSAVGRGWCTIEQVEAVNQELLRQLHPIQFAGIYYSPDIPGMPSETRKPAPGMLLRAAQEHGLNLNASFMIGDKDIDVVCGYNAGCRTVWVARDTKYLLEIKPDYQADNLLQASEWILSCVKKERQLD